MPEHTVDWSDLRDMVVQMRMLEAGLQADDLGTPDLLVRLAYFYETDIPGDPRQQWMAIQALGWCQSHLIQLASHPPSLAAFGLDWLPQMEVYRAIDGAWCGFFRQVCDYVDPAIVQGEALTQDVDVPDLMIEPRHWRTVFPSAEQVRLCEAMGVVDDRVLDESPAAVAVNDAADAAMMVDPNGVSGMRFYLRAAHIVMTEVVADRLLAKGAPPEGVDFMCAFLRFRMFTMLPPEVQILAYDV